VVLNYTQAYVAAVSFLQRFIEKKERKKTNISLSCIDRPSNTRYIRVAKKENPKKSQNTKCRRYILSPITFF